MNAQQDKKDSANRVVSDPSFNALHFFKDMSIHYQNDEVIRSLCSDAGIILSLIEEDCHQALLKKPKFINPVVFEQMHNMGLEVWKKDTGHGKCWYGVIVNDNLVLFFRRVGNQYNDDKNMFDVYTKPSGKCGKDDKIRSLPNEQRRRWRRIKMRKIGSILAAKKANKPWTPPLVWNIRKTFTEFLDTEFNMANYNNKWDTGHYFSRGGIGSSNYCYSFALYKIDPNQRWKRDKIFKLNFRILADGKKRVKLCVDDLPKNFTIDPPEHGFTPTSETGGRQVTVTSKFLMNDPLLNLKMIDFATSISTDGSKFREGYLEPKITELLKETGL